MRDRHGRARRPCLRRTVASSTRTSSTWLGTGVAPEHRSRRERRPVAAAPRARAHEAGRERGRSHAGTNGMRRRSSRGARWRRAPCRARARPRPPGGCTANASSAIPPIEWPTSTTSRRSRSSTTARTSSARLSIESRPSRRRPWTRRGRGGRTRRRGSRRGGSIAELLGPDPATSSRARARTGTRGRGRARDGEERAAVGRREVAGLVERQRAEPADVGVGAGACPSASDVLGEPQRRTPARRRPGPTPRPGELGHARSITTAHS